MRMVYQTEAFRFSAHCGTGKLKPKAVMKFVQVLLVGVLMVAAATEGWGQCSISGTPNACEGTSVDLKGSGSAANTDPWVSSNTAVATIDDKGVVQAKAQGTTFITYTTNSGCVTTITFTVNPLPTISGTTSVCTGSNITLSGSGTPDSSSPWTSSDNAVAGVTSSGVVNGIKPGTVTITYKNINGCTKTTTVTVNDLPSISGGPSVCVNATITLTGNVSANATSPWVSANTSVATITSAGVLTGKGEGNVNIQFKDINGCISKPATITVKGLPDFTGDLSKCVGQTSTLTGDPTPASTNPWSTSNAAFATVSGTGTTGTVNAIAAGSADITYTNSDGCKISKPFTTIALPTPDFNPALPGNGCSGNTVSFTNTTVNSGNFEFLWTFGDGKTSTDLNPTYRYKPKGNGATTQYTVTLAATDKTTGCTGSKSKVIDLKEAPSVNLVNPATGLAITSFKNCQAVITNPSFSVQFRDKSTGVGTLTINWGDGTSEPSQAFVDAKLFSHAYTAVGVYNVVYTATASNGCSVSETFQVFNISNPAIGAATSGSTTGLCSPATLTFSITNTNSNDASTVYTIIPQQGGPSQTFTHPPPPTFTATYSESSCNNIGVNNTPNSFYFTVTAKNGCGETSGIVSPITIAKPPTASVDPVSRFVCVNTPAQLLNKTIAGNDINVNCSNDAQFNFAFGDGTFSPSTDFGLASEIGTTPDLFTSYTSPTTVSKTYTAAGTYIIKLRAKNSCPETSDTTRVVVCGGLPNSAFKGSFNTLSANSTAVQSSPGLLDLTGNCAPLTVPLTNLTTNICNSTYQWSVVSGPAGATFTGGLPTSTAFNTAINLNAGGTYLLRLRATNPCGPSDSFLQIIVPQGPTTPPVITSSPFYCSVDNITLSAGAVTGATTYLWTITGVAPTPDPVITVNRTSLSIGPFKLPAGTYLATLRASNACGFIDGTKTIEVRSTPEPTIGTPFLTFLCQGQSVNLSAGTSGGTFQWFLDGIAVSPGGTLSQLAVTNSGVAVNTNRSYTLQQTINGCAATSAAQVITLRVNPAVSITTSPTQFCPGVAISAPFTSTVTPAGSYTFSWFKDNAAITGANASTFTAPAVGAYKLKADDGFCPVESSPVNISLFTVNPITASASKSPLCIGESTNLSAAGTGTFTFTWSGSGLSATTGSPVIATPTATGSLSYSLTARDANNCEQQKTVSVTVNAKPTVTLSGSKSEICLDGVSSSTLTAGGTATSYTWSPATGLSATTGASVIAKPTLASTTYTVTGTDGNGCTNTAAFEVKGRTAITASINSAQPKVFCEAGLVNATLNAVTSPSRTFNYQWKEGSTNVGTNSATFSTNSVGSYTVVVSDTDNLCSATTIPWVISLFTPGSVAISPAAPEVCKYQSVSITISGATSYVWSPATGLSATTGATVTAKPLTNTTYSVEATDGNGCKLTQSVTVTVLQRPTVSITNSKPTICLDGTDNTTLAATGASTYLWSPATGLSATTGASVTAKPTVASTTYSVVGTDAKGCQDTTTVVVAGRDKINVTLGGTPLKYCPADAVNTTINATATPARSFVFSWTKDGTSTTGSTASLTATATGSYAVTVKDTDNVCTVTSTPLVIDRFTLPTISITPSAPEICKFQSTSLTASGAVSYTWAPNTRLSATSGATVTASPLATLTYTVTATDANNCKQDQTVSVTVNNLPTVVVSNSKPTICLDGTDNTTLAASGATSYVWSPATGLSGTTTASVTAKPAVASTTYSVIGTDTKGCKDTTTVVVAGRDKINVTLGGSPQKYCPGDAVNTTITTTVSPARTYAFSWSKDGTALTETTANLTAVATGSYTATVKDTDNVCSTTSTALVIDRFVLPTVTITPATPGICKFKSTTLTASGAVSYTWAPSIALSATAGATVTASPLSTQEYTITATDNNNCKQDKKVTVQVNDRPVVAVSNSKPTICLDGTDTSTLTASGAVTYTWSPATGLSGTATASVTAKPAVASTTYEVIGTDAIGCQDTTTVVVAGRDKINVSITGTPSRYCPGDPVNTNITSTISPARSFAFSWTKDGASTPGSASSLTATATGSYALTVKDTDNVCTSVSSPFVIDLFILPAISISPVSPEICKFQSTSLTASGAVSYVWSPDIRISATTGATVTVSPLSTQTYTLTATDNNNCKQVTTRTVTVNNLPTVTIVPGKTELCQGSSTSLTASGAVSYVWSPSALLSGTTGVSVTATPTALGANVFKVIGTDAKTCKDTTEVTLNVREGINIALAPSTDQFFCEESDVNRQIDATVTPDRPGYTFQWLRNDAPVGTNAKTFTATSTGTYKLKVTDVACEATSLATVIKLFTKPTVTFTPLSGREICRYDSLQITASGAVSYSWTPMASLRKVLTSGATVKASPAATQTYSVEATDNNSCKQTLSYVVNVNQLPTVSITASKTQLCQGNTAVMTATGASTYAWSPASFLSATTGGSVNANPTVLGDNEVTVIGTDVKSCKDTAKYILNVREGITISLNPFTEQFFCEETDITTALVATVSPDRPGYTFQWLKNTSTPVGTNTKTFNPTTVGSYQLKVTDVACEATSAATKISLFAKPVIVFSPASPREICRYDSLQITSTGAVDYAWTPGTGLKEKLIDGSVVKVSPAATQTYEINTTDSNNCRQKLNYTVNVNQLPVVSVNANKTELCVGQSSNLTASSPSTGMSYIWSPSAELSSSTGAAVTATPAASTLFQVIGTDSKTCKDTTTVQINVRAVFTISAATTDSLLYCAANTINTLIKATITPTRSNTITWLRDNVDLPGTDNTDFIAKTIGTFKARVSDGVCDAFSNPITVGLFPRPVIAFNKPTPSEICRYDSLAITISGARDYTWSPAAGLTATVGPSVKASPASTTDYVVRSVDFNNCPAYHPFKLVINQLPVVVLSPTDNSLCYGTSADITATGASTYAWSPATGLSATTGNKVKAQPLDTVDYSVVGTDLKGCKDTTDLKLTVRPKIPAEITTSGKVTFCTPSEISATLVTPAVAGFTYEWFRDNVAIPTSNNPFFLATQIGKYTVKVRDGDLKCDTVSTPGFDIAVFPRDPLKISPAAPAICRGYPIDVTASGAQDYFWTAAGEPDRTGSAVNLSPPNTVEFSLKSLDKFGCPDSLKFNLEVNDVPKVSVSATDEELCLGQSSDLTASADIPVSFKWSPPAGLNSTTLAFVTATPVITTTYDVIGKTTFGCSDTASVKITVFNLPALSAGIDDVFCDNWGNVDLDDNPGLAPPGGEWTGIAISTGNIFDPAGAVIGTNTLTYTVTDPATGCKNSDNILLTVRKPPEVNFTAPSRICINVPFPLTNTTPAFSGNTLSYEWDFGNGLTTTNTNGSTQFTTAGTYPVKLYTESTPDHCFNEIIKDILAVDPPKALFSRSVPGATLCGPLKILFNNESTGTELSYDWNFGNGITSTALAPDSVLYIPHPLNDTTYTVKLRVVSGEPTCPPDEATDLIKLNPNPTASFLFAQDPICADFPLPLNNFSFGKPTSFIWYFGDGTAPLTLTRLGTTSHIFRNDRIVDTTYTVSLVAINNCKRDSLTRVITVTPNTVTAFFEALTIQGCQPLTVNFKSNQIPASKNELIWEWGDGNFTYGDLNPTHTFDADGEFMPKLVVRNGCNIDTCQFNNGVPLCGAKIKVLKNPEPKFTVDSPVCDKQPAQITNLTLDQVGSDWDFGDGTLPKSDFGNPKHVFPGVGDYTIKHDVRYSNGCTRSYTQPVRIVPLPNPAFEVPPIICEDREFTATNISSGAQSYLWRVDLDGGDAFDTKTNLITTVPDYGNYRVNLIAFTKPGQTGCIDSVSRVISVGRLPELDFGFGIRQQCDTVLIGIRNFSTYPNASEGTFEWYVDVFRISQLYDPDTLLYRYSEDKEREATLTFSATSINGCSNSITKDLTLPAFTERIKVPDKPLAFVPGDPVEGYFRLNTDNAKKADFSMSIYGQWGNEFFKTTDKKAIWDGYYQGQIAPAGAYYTNVVYRGCSTNGQYNVQVPILLLKSRN